MKIVAELFLFVLSTYLLFYGFPVMVGRAILKEKFRFYVPTTRECLYQGYLLLGKIVGTILLIAGTVAAICIIVVNEN